MTEEEMARRDGEDPDELKHMDVADSVSRSRRTADDGLSLSRMMNRLKRRK